MKARRLALAMIGALIFVWGCGSDDPTTPKNGGNGGGPTSQAWTTPGGDFDADASGTVDVAGIGMYQWRPNYPAAWASAGGDYAAGASASAQVADVGDYRWGSTAGMVADVQDWTTSPANDFGWLILGDETVPSAKRFGTRENPDPSDRPMLTVYYDAMPTPVVIPSVKDNTLVESLAGDLSNGAGEYMFAGRTGQGPVSKRRALVCFSVADSIPSTAIIDSVFLDLNMSKTDGHPQAFTLTLHKLTSDWGEAGSHAPGEEGKGDNARKGDATWLYPFFDYPNTDLVTDVQGWVTTPASNFGWILKGLETMPSAKRFDTRDNPNESVRPRLLVYRNASTSADTVHSARDNTIFEDIDQLTNRSNGAGEHMFAGKTNETTYSLRRALVFFDVAAALGSSATIDSVVLELTMSKTGNTSPLPVSLHRLLADWGEAGSKAPGEEGEGADAESGDATWFFRVFVP